MKKTIEVCCLCGREDCSGVEYETEHMYGTYGLDIGKKVVCRSHPQVKVIDGELKFHVISSHGEETYYDLEVKL